MKTIQIRLPDTALIYPSSIRVNTWSLQPTPLLNPTCFSAGSCFPSTTCAILRCTQRCTLLCSAQAGTIAMTQKSSTTQSTSSHLLRYGNSDTHSPLWWCHPIPQHRLKRFHQSYYAPHNTYTISELSPSLHLVLPFGSNWNCPGPALTLLLLYLHQSICKDLLSRSPAILLYIDIYS